MRRRVHRPRLFVVFIIFISFFAFYAGRVVYLQVFRSSHLIKLADKQHNVLLELSPERGDIYDTRMRPFALDCKVHSVFAVPDEMDGGARSAAVASLPGALGVDAATVARRLARDKSFVWIKRELEKGEAEAVESLGLEGIGLIKENKRFYPAGALASHIIGFAGTDDTGLEGVELAYDTYLKGVPGWRWTVRDAKRRDILSGDKKVIPPCDGLDVVLTIDETIQHIAERELDRAYKKYNAAGASIIVMDPATGDILALANRPAFDLNDFSSSCAEERRNRALTDIYEPGSVFKVITASCALENGVADVDDEFFCENGSYYVGGRTLHDHRPLGTLTFREVIEKSSNIGVTKIAQLIGEERLYSFIRLFGFGELTGIDIPGEVEGIVRPPEAWSAVSISAIPMGQEIAVTSVQLARAISAIANGGCLIRPRIVKRVCDKDGNTIKSFPKAAGRKVISPPTAGKMKDILQGVVENGTGRRARLERYTAAGKTGTAQKVEPDGRYSHSKFVASFMGFAPAKEPRISIIVCVDEPRPVYYGGSVAAPVFREVARDTLMYLKVEADRAEETAEL